jgi:hypothetical protein
MRIPTWRLALTGSAIVILLAIGIGLVAASTASPAAQDSAALAAGSPAPGASGHPDRPGIKRFLGREGRLGVGRRVVHVVGTFLDKDGNLVTIQVDHGTVKSIGAGSLTVAEAGGSSVTVSTDGSTIVWVGKTKGALSDLKVGDTIFVQSRLDGGTTLAKRVLKVPPA